MTKSEFSEFLFSKFLEWEKTQPGKRSSYSAFARHLSKNSFKIKVPQQMVSGWINGDFRPGDRYAPVLAEFSGDEIYELLGLTPPDLLLTIINLEWKELTPEQQGVIHQSFLQFLSENKARSSNETHPA